MQCPSCGSRDIDFHEAGGHSACVKCGTVVEENVIVSSIEFQVRNRFADRKGKSDHLDCPQLFNIKLFTYLKTIGIRGQVFSDWSICFSHQ